MAVLGLQIVALVLASGLRIRPLTSGQDGQERRPLPHVVRQPTFLVATLGSMVSYGLMVFIMTATPLAMAAEHHSFGSTALVIQWHILGMFGPALVTGWLIQWLGVLTIMLIGALLMLGCMIINLMGIAFWHFAIALLLLGLGWNFLYVGSTALLTEAYQPAEKATIQALHDFLVFGFVALATFLSGRLFAEFSWPALNHVSWPLILLTLLTILGLQWHRQSRSHGPGF